MEIDFSQTKEYRPIHAAGYFEATIVSTDFYKKDGKDYHILRVSFSTADTTIEFYAVVSRDSKKNGNMLSLLKALGQDPSKQKVNVNFDDLIGQKCIISVAHERGEYEGRSYIKANIKRVFHPKDPDLEGKKIYMKGDIVEQEPSKDYAQDDSAPF